jgi:type I restriction enzyme, S subunit
MLPEGWTITKFASGFTSSREKACLGLPTLSVTIYGGLVDRDSIDRKMDTNLEAHEHLLVRKGDIAYNMMRMWQGASGLAEHDAMVSPAYVVLRAKKGMDSLFASYLFKLRRTIYQFWAYSYGLTDDRLRLYPKDFGMIPVILPPIAEQRRIAEILSTWDRAISVQEQLVANARAQKKALMQTLLTGKKRLPGFNGEWKRVRLGQLGEFRKGSGILRDQVLEAGFPCIRYGEIYTTHHDQIREFASFIESESALEAERLVTGDLLFTCSGETAAEIGKCVAYLGSCEAYAGGDIILLNPTGHNSLFMSYVLNSANVIEQKRKFGQGNSVVHISAANLAKLSFKTPARWEQDAIATTIDSVSDLIRRGEDDLAKMKLQKSALMQQLLTGKRRVKVEAIEQ